MVLFVGLLVGFELRGGELIDGFEINSVYESDTTIDDGEAVTETSSDSDDEKTKASKSASSSAKSSSSKELISNEEKISSEKESSEYTVVDAVVQDQSHLPYNTIGNTLSNILNGGFAAQQGEWIYYSESEDSDKLYRMKKSGSDVERISDHSVEYINVVGESIVVRDTSHSSRIAVYKTTSIELKTKIFFNPYYITLLNNNSFISSDYTYQSAIYQYYLGEDYQNYLNNDYVTKMAGVYNNKVYYIDESNGSNLLSINLQNDIKTNNISKSVDFYGINDTGIYFVSDGYLYSQNDLEIPIIEDRVGCINVTSYLIYYSNLDDGGKLYRMDLQGNSNVCLTDCSVDSVCIAGGWIFYKNNGTVKIL